MAYIKQNFYNGQVLTHEHLNHIEDGIEAIEGQIPSMAKDASAFLNAPEDSTPSVPLMYEINDFRRKDTAYQVGDKVACAFRYEFFLECTQAGTTSSDTLDTRNVSHGQVISDGTCQWTVRTHVRSINGAVADANGNVTISVGEAGSNVEIDSSLTHSGQAADAKAVGDAINAVPKNFKKINGESILGSGNIVINSSNGGVSVPTTYPEIVLDWEVGGIFPGADNADDYKNLIRTVGSFSSPINRTLKIKATRAFAFYIFKNSERVVSQENLSATDEEPFEITFAIEAGNNYRLSYCPFGKDALEDTSCLQYLTITGLEEVTVGGSTSEGVDTSSYAGTTHRFTVGVNCYTPTYTNTTELQDGKTEYADNGVIMFPDSYTDNGKPTRLVIHCHGAGGTVTTNDSQTEDFITAKYLVANGYAVMDVNGLPQEFATNQGIDIKNNVGSPIAIQSYIKAYRYCIRSFNLFPEVFVFGASMGGISSTNLVMSGAIPVIAHGAFCPVLDTYNEIFLHPWSSGAPKTALAKFFGFELSGSDYVYDEEKVKGYNPVNNKTVTINGEKYTDYPVPVKFWQCENDPTVSYQVTKDFVDAILRAGRTAHLRSFPTGGHEPQDVGNAIASPLGNTTYRGQKLSIKPAAEEVLLWFNRYND